MKLLSKTQSATELVEDINSNLQDMSSQVEVAVTDSATSLASELNTALGVNTLDADDDAETFITALNTAFENAVASSWPSIIPEFNPTKYGAEMDDTMGEVNKLKNNADFIMLVSTDIHYEKQKTVSVNKNGTTYQVPLMNGTGISDHSDTFTPMMSNHCDFLRRAKVNGIKVDAIVNLGDFFDGRRTAYTSGGVEIMSAEERVAEYLKSMTHPYKALSNAYNVPLIFALGNHDDNYDEQYGWCPASFDTLYNWFLKDTVDPKNKSTNEGGTAYSGGLDYYIDFDSAKIRVVVIFCQEGLGTTGGAYYSSTKTANNWTIPTASYNYLVSCVNSLPEGYKVFLLGHTHPVMSRGAEGGTNLLMDYLEEHSDTIIGYICGHAHTDWVRGYPIASISHVCGLQTGWRDDDDLWSVIAIKKGNGLDGLIHLIRFGQNGAWAYKDANNVWHCDQSGNYKIHYNPIIGTVGETITLVPSISNVTNWYMDATSWCGFTAPSAATGVTTKTASGYASYQAANDNSSCEVTINARDASYPQIICVRAKNADTCEYWFIKIPKTT